MTRGYQPTATGREPGTPPHQGTAGVSPGGGTWPTPVDQTTHALLSAQILLQWQSDLSRLFLTMLNADEATKHHAICDVLNLLETGCGLVNEGALAGMSARFLRQHCRLMIKLLDTKEDVRKAAQDARDYDPGGDTWCETDVFRAKLEEVE